MQDDAAHKDYIIRIVRNGIGDACMTIYHPPSQTVVGKEIKSFESQHKVRDELLAEMEKKLRKTWEVVR